MAWFIKLFREDMTDRVFSLIDGANIEELQRQLADAPEDAVVRLPVRMTDQIRESPLFLRPYRWDAWQFFHHDGEVIE
ncbi:MAG: hypothetical protein ACI38U_09290 [Corynebacterium sp.]|uniref:hypothetical protein n=1 Tax=Corynebacterium sp. TaxID=1720 RepID=UPI003F0774DE